MKKKSDINRFNFKVNAFKGKIEPKLIKYLMLTCH